MPDQRLLDVARRMIRAGTGQDMYRTLVTRARRALGRGVNTSFFLVYRASDMVLPVAESTQSGRRLHPEAYTQKITTGIIGRVVKSGKLYYAADVSKDPLFVSGGQTQGSEVCAPVLVDGEVVGILNIEAPERDAFSPPLIGSIELLCEVAGALMNMGVAQEQQKAVEAQNRGLQDAAAAADARFAALADALDQLVLILDSDGKIVFANGAWGGEVRAAVGRDVDSVLEPASAAALEKLAGSAGPVQLQFRLGKRRVAAAGRATAFSGPAGASLILLVLAPGAAGPAKKGRKPAAPKRRKPRR